MTRISHHLAALSCFLVLAVCSVSAFAVECDQKVGCMPETSNPHDIGNGALLTIPDGWRYYTFPMPPQPKGLTNIRIYSDGVKIGITGFPNLDHRNITDAFVEDIVTRSGTQYLPSTGQSMVQYMSVTHDSVVGGYANFNGLPDKPSLKPFPDFPAASVKVMILAYNDMLYLITIASKTLDEPDAETAFALFKHLQ